MALRVLIVDDSPAMRKFVQRVLTLTGLPLEECRTAADGVDALSALRAAPADIILTDINMPRMDGEQLVREVAGDPALAGTPIVVVSTDHTDARRDRLYALGVRGYVAKPFYPETLREEIERVLAHPGATPTPS